MTSPTATAGDVDPFRDTPLRYLGYANELGESFKAFISKGIYRSTYALSIAYALGDAVHKGTHAKRGLDQHEDRNSYEPASSEISSLSASREIAIAMADTAVWQLLASVIIPGVIINRAVSTAGWVVSQAPGGDSISDNRAVNGSMKRFTPFLKRWAPTTVGLALIPFIIHPIDSVVTQTMDEWMRPYYITDAMKAGLNSDSETNTPTKEMS
mmetsp:Transcript_7846/g.14892  ORF Transcript_7846/g.14892 Transcript_7846/m.14892 type:complete len:212 (-) Transcript_7846:104-739(-)